MSNTARALICTEHDTLAVDDVVLPDAGDEDVLVRTLYSGVSVGTEFAVLSGKLDWGPMPLVTGYQGVGVVLDAGSAVTDFSVGDHVYYRDNARIALADETPVNAAAGVHCSHALINTRTTHGLAKLPDGIDLKAASLFVLPAVGLHGVNAAGVSVGDRVCVFGLGPIGLGVVAAASRRGAEVIGIDVSAPRLALAAEFGAGVTERLDPTAIPGDELVSRLGEFDAVFEATGLHTLIDPAVRVCRPGATFVWQGNYGEGPVSFEFLSAHMKQIRMTFPCNDGLAPARAAVIRAMADGTLRWERTISHVVPSREAPQFYEAVRNRTLPEMTAAVIEWAAR
jgi:2-desacetyl-2-hydroxyethyl bacteriochlorophyllide A dehydrogenase